MKNTFLRIVSLIFIFIILFAVGSLQTFADESSEGTTQSTEEETEITEEIINKIINKNSTLDEMAECFNVVKGSNGMKYAYFSPVKDENDMTKYPLVIYIHGQFHGWTEKTFKKSGLTYWCTEEIQSMFNAGGAHLLMPKRTESPVAFNQPQKVYEVICEYIEQNSENVDTSRIFLMGGSVGGGVAWKLLIQHPEMFCAGVMMCSMKSPTKDEMQIVADIPIWEISAVTDPLAFFALIQRPTWKKITEYSNVKNQCRWTVFDKKVTLPDGTHPFISHFLAKTIGYNLCLFDDDMVLPGCTTVDGDGNDVEITIESSIVQWLDNVSSTLDFDYDDILLTD